MIVGCDWSEGPQDYSSEEHGFYVKFPEGWGVCKDKNDPNLVIEALNYEGENLFVVEEAYVDVNVTSGEMTLDEFFKPFFENIKADKKVVFLEKGQSVFNSRKVKWVVTSEWEDVRKVIRYVFIKGKKVFVVGFSAAPEQFNKNRKLYDQVIINFKFI